MYSGISNSNETKHLIRWRGRTQGPLPISEIEDRLNAGQIGLLTEIQFEGRWMTLREFHVHQQTKPQAPVESSDIGQGAMSAGPAQPAPLPAQANSRRTRGGKGKRGLVIALTTVCALCLLGYLGLTSRVFRRSNERKEATASTDHQPATNATGQVATLPVATNTAQATVVVTNADTAPPKDASNVVATTSTTSTNSRAPTAASTNVWDTIASPSLPPLPEDEPRNFQLKNGTNYFGTIISVDAHGLIIRLGLGGFEQGYTKRLDWSLFDAEALAREPQVIAFKTAQETARQAAERAKALREAAAELARAAREAAEARLAEFHAKQDAIIEKSIRDFGCSAVTKEYLKGWGTHVTIGEIFAVVAPSAHWSAAKLASYEAERYTHYLVEARWANDEGEPVTMQYLVSADGSQFHLHGFFISGTKMPNAIFLPTVKAIWDKHKNR